MKSIYKLSQMSSYSAQLALSLIAAAVFLPMIYRLGFYWDDWPSIWFLHNWGPTIFTEGFSIDRPFLAWVFKLTTPLFKESSAAWQLFSIFTRLLCGLAWLWTLRGLWSQKPQQAFWAAALFTVYPGFGQQYIAVTYSNAFFVFFLFILSIGSMIWAHRLRRWFWPLMAFSVISSAFCMFVTEYFYTLELLRPILLWLVIRNPRESRQTITRKVIVRWLPYLAFLLPLIISRAFINPSPRAEIVFLDNLINHPIGTIFELIRTVIQDFLEVNFLAWLHALDLRFLKGFDQNVIIWMVVSIVLSFLFALIYLLFSKPMTPEAADIRGSADKSWAWQTIALGAAAFLLSGWTIWLTNLHIELLFPFDRFTMITMLGTSLLISGIIGLLDRKPSFGAVIVALLVGLSAATQFQHRLVYRQEWLSQKAFFWQLSWRAPNLQHGTTVITSKIPFSYYSDNSLTAPLNWMYSPELKSKEMPYLLFDIEARLGQGLDALEGSQIIRMPYRAASFEGSTSQAIVLFFDPPRCLKVMNPELDRFLPVKPLYIREATPLSRLDLILPESDRPAQPPARIFGPEPAHTWCYFFEKAELYAQSKEWERVVEMADQALKITKHFTEKNVSELIPFTMGYAHIGKWKKAVELSMQAYEVWEKTQYPLCDAWQSILDETEESEEKQSASEEIQNLLGCKFH